MTSTAAVPQKIDRLDGRTILFLIVCACLVTFMAANLLSHALFTFGLVLLLCALGYPKQGFGALIFYGLMLSGLWAETRYHISFPSPLLLSMLYKMTLLAIPVYLLTRIPSGKLTASLRKLPIPPKFMLVLIVMLRFGPTVIHESGEVKDAMRVRGFLKSPGTVLRHPMNTLEYAITPMVFRSLKIADKLAASAIVRGIESPCKKESYYVSRMTILDGVLMAATTAASILCCMV